MSGDRHAVVGEAIILRVSQSSLSRTHIIESQQHEGRQSF